MSIIEKSLQKVGLEVVGDALPQGQRTVKAFRRLIAAMRAAEAEVQDALTTAQRGLNDSLQKNTKLLEKNRELETKLLRYGLSEKIDNISKLTVEDKTRLLEVCH
jgi:hypothetical protein